MRKILYTTNPFKVVDLVGLICHHFRRIAIDKLDKSSVLECSIVYTALRPSFYLRPTFLFATYLSVYAQVGGMLLLL